VGSDQLKDTAMKKLLLSAAFLAAFGLGIGIAQINVNPAIVQSVGANDLFQDIIGGNSAPYNSYATPGLLGNTTSVAYSVPLTAFTITQGVGTTWTIINPAGTLATGTFTFNATPTNGSRACFVSTQTQTAVTFTGNTGQTVTGAPTAMVAGTPVCFTYVTSVTTWFKA
jgi:hypothetical protein